MKGSFVLAAATLLSHGSQAVSVDSWTQRRAIQPRVIPPYEPIEVDELKARLGTTPEEHNPGERSGAIVYFCRGENWGPPCFAYHPELGYACSELGPELSGHVGSVFVEPAIICRFSSGLSPDNRCAATKIFAWPETRDGWPDILSQQTPGGEGKLGIDSTHFTCAQCTNCVDE